MFKVKKPAPDARILRIRDYEDKLQSMQGKVAEQVRSCLARAAVSGTRFVAINLQPDQTLPQQASRLSALQGRCKVKCARVCRLR
jgi:hypothetical protein